MSERSQKVQNELKVHVALHLSSYDRYCGSNSHYVYRPCPRWTCCWTYAHMRAHSQFQCKKCWPSPPWIPHGFSQARWTATLEPGSNGAQAPSHFIVFYSLDQENSHNNIIRLLHHCVCMCTRNSEWTVHIYAPYLKAVNNIGDSVYTQPNTLSNQSRG